MPVSSTHRPAPEILKLGEGFADEVEPARFPRHTLRFRNQGWAARVGLGDLSREEWERHFALFEPLPGNLKRPLALRYHGHQFRVYNPDLGDGRGFLFAQFRDPRDGRLLDLGTKGSGQTPYSRAGDGRLTLKGAVREALATEMLESLGVPTSKTFSIFETGESLERHDEPSPTRSGVLVRLSHGHIRFGTFQRLAFHRDAERVRALLEYSIKNYYPELHATSESQKAAAFLREVALRSAELCASWMIAGFVHGVLNSDNMNITGEGFDYGPYRFLPKYDPDFTAAYFDHSGLYAYGRQPDSVLWNLEQLALSLRTIADPEPLVDALNAFPPRFNAAIVERFMDRLGLVTKGDDQDDELFIASFDLLAQRQVGFEQFFHDWYAAVAGSGGLPRAKASPEAEKYQGPLFEKFLALIGRYEAMPAARRRLDEPYMKQAKPCSLLIDEIEWIWDAIDKVDDWSRFDAKINAIREMGKFYGRRDV